MVVISESVSCRSLDFANQRKAYMLRHVKKLAWEKIADKVVNLRVGLDPKITLSRDESFFRIIRGQNLPTL